jgi:hypothetical protein
MMIFFVSQPVIHARTIKELFLDANQKFKNSEFQEALKNYLELETTYHIQHPDLYLNTGNAYFQLGKYGYAILYYKKALALKPEKLVEERARKNIEKVRSLLILRQEKAWSSKFVYDESHGLFFSLFSLVDRKFSAPFFLAGYFLTFVTFVLVRLFFNNMRLKKICCRIFFPSLFVMTIAGTLFFSREYIDRNYTLGIVVSDGVRLFSEHSSESSGIKIPEGLEVRLLKKDSDGFSEIELSSGRKGFVRSEEVAEIPSDY